MILMKASDAWPHLVIALNLVLHVVATAAIGALRYPEDLADVSSRNMLHHVDSHSR